MANVKIVGDAVVITSALKLEDIKLVQKTFPKKLSLYEEDETGKMNPYFRVEVGTGEVRPTDVSQYGITFRKESREGGFAQITCKIPAGEGDPKELVAEAFGGPLMSLCALEEALPQVVDSINDRKQAVLASIEVV